MFSLPQEQHSVERFTGTKYNQHQRVWGSLRQNHHTAQEEAAVRGLREESQSQEGKLTTAQQHAKQFNFGDYLQYVACPLEGVDAIVDARL